MGLGLAGRTFGLGLQRPVRIQHWGDQDQPLATPSRRSVYSRDPEGWPLEFISYS